MTKSGRSLWKESLAFLLNVLPQAKNITLSHKEHKVRKKDGCLVTEMKDYQQTHRQLK